MAVVSSIVTTLLYLLPLLIKGASKGGRFLGKASRVIGKGSLTGAKLAGKGARKGFSPAVMTLFALDALKGLMGGDEKESQQDPMAGFPMPGDMGQEGPPPPQMMMGGQGNFDISQLLIPPMPQGPMPQMPQLPPPPQLLRPQPRQFYQ